MTPAEPEILVPQFLLFGGREGWEGEAASADLPWSGGAHRPHVAELEVSQGGLASALPTAAALQQTDPGSSSQHRGRAQTSKGQSGYMPCYFKASLEHTHFSFCPCNRSKLIRQEGAGRGERLWLQGMAETQQEHWAKAGGGMAASFVILFASWLHLLAPGVTRV